jgi:O-acetyl-ADP-ribose deacetylase (regulator of RNase III)
MNTLPLARYRSLIALDEVFAATPGPVDVSALLEHLQAARPAGASAREALYAHLIARPPAPLPTGALESVDALLATEASQRETVDARALPRLADSGWRAACSLWRGDITRLRVDAIVNACNSALLGCFTPFHACIDNAIHAAAGPRLRADCHAMMSLQGHEEPTGVAKVTRGYHLPAGFVLHTVGPICERAAAVVTPRQREALASCYRACLSLAVEVGARSVAFPCISTGVFGFPAAPAARIALDTVATWLAANPGRMEHVVFNVFGVRDEALYRAALEEAAP